MTIFSAVPAMVQNISPFVRSSDVGLMINLPVQIAQADAGDGPVKRDVGDGHGGGRADHGGDLRRVVVVDGEDGTRDDDVVSQVAGEEGGASAGRSWRAARTPAFARTALAAQKAARDSADRVKLFLEVDAEREVIDAVARPARTPWPSRGRSFRRSGPERLRWPAPRACRPSRVSGLPPSVKEYVL